MARNIKTDKFGNDYQVVGCKENKNGYLQGWVEIGGKLYKLEPSESRNEKYGMWIRVTKMKPRSNGGRF